METKLDELVEKKKTQVNKISTTALNQTVTVFRSSQNKVEELPIETYVAGVVAGEMPADFEEEALKAQALAARTYIVNRLANQVKEKDVHGADVTDTIQNQVFRNNAELKSLWGKEYESKMKKITTAVKETAGQILTYQGKPITAAFFSTSNGYTENSGEYWKEDLPYLKSVASPWDAKSPKFQTQITMKVKDFENRLGVNIESGNEVGTIISRTPGKRVEKIKIDGKEFSGREIREKLNLASTDFDWSKKGNLMIITAKGSGHGIGMSQYGANYMAQDGKTYKDIVEHYYKDVNISSASSLFPTQTAKR